MPEATRVPKLTVDARATPARLTALEGFVLSRIDGKVTENELGSLTGLPEAQVRATLDRLVSLRMVTFDSGDGSPRLPAPEAVSAPAPAATDSAALTGDGARLALPPGPAPAEARLSPRVEAAIAQVPRDTPELREDVDIPESLRVRVLAMTAVLGSLDYYELLSLDPAADKKSIKRSYFELASQLHPDRYFRKRLGTYKPKMEAIFGRVTQAYETLSSKEAKVEYDTYLADLNRTRAIEELLRSADAEARQAEQDAQRALARSSFPGGVPAAASGPPVAAAPAPSVPPAVQPAVSGFYSSIPGTPDRRPAAPAASPVVSDQARRDALAMRLLGSRAAQRATSAPPGGASAAAAQRGAPPDGGDALKRRYEERLALARKAQADKYVALARESETKNDVIGAATAYRVALGFIKEDDAVLAVANAVIAKADAQLSETYLRQAQYEDREQHWTDAARSWQKVAKGRPNDARAHERSANALVLSKGDLHLAAELAKRAIEIEPRNADYKVTLANVFLEAGLALNARRELEAAQQLSPRNANIQALLKRVNKAG